MAEIQPFRGLRYDQRRVRLEDVIAPPYDVISPEYQNELYRRSPYNIVRLILGRDSDRYAEASTNLQQWKEEGILRRDDAPSLYCLGQSFCGLDGSTLERTGWIVNCKLEDFSAGVILPHERTLSKPKEDRFRLKQATKTNLSQVLGLYSDPEERGEKILQDVKKANATLTVEFEEVINQLWIVGDNDLVREVSEILRDKSILIADGHHRYETALAYRDLMHLKSGTCTGREPFNFTMMFLTNIEAPGLVIFPTHRIVHHLQDFDSQRFLNQLGENFDILPEASPEAMMQSLAGVRSFAFGIVLRQGLFFIRLKKPQSVLRLVGAQVSPELRELDVTLLHSFILEKVLGITQEAQEKKANLDYVKDVQEVFRAIHNDTVQAGILMNATRVDQVRRVARSGQTMPQKSTFFYPKLPSGLVMNPLES
jgi:uncharacterized protein (DUF1015 family)